MLATVLSGTTIGLDGVLIKVEVDVAGRGFPTLSIVGLPNKAIEEAKERVRAAINNVSFDMPDSRTVVNLAPADIPKEGSLFDLPIAIGILAAQRNIDLALLERSLFIGELSLQGEVRFVSGVLPIALMARKKGIQNLFVPQQNQIETSLVKDIDVYPVATLTQLILHLNGKAQITPAKKLSLSEIVSRQQYSSDFSEVKGQEKAKRALEIAAAGFHNIHMHGPPGAGKTLLARSLPSILPKLDSEEIIEVCKISSITQHISGLKLVASRPFRSPHHTISRVGLVGGGTKLTPGEISLAHRGVLFLDEFPEFPRSVLEALRQPLEDGVVTISRAVGSVTFPARFMLVSASNPCPCGFLGHPQRKCACSSYQVDKYIKRISGPILDRIDLHIEIPPVEYSKLMQLTPGESSKEIRSRVENARSVQTERLKHTRVKTNGEMSSAAVRKFCNLSDESSNLLAQAVSQLSLSARSYFKILKIARTIGDLDSSDSIHTRHVAEALQYRSQTTRG